MRAGRWRVRLFLVGELVDFSQWAYRLPSATAPQLLSELAEPETVLARRSPRGPAQAQASPHGCSANGGRHDGASRWLVGCDGGRSVMRKAAGFKFAGTEPEFTGYSAQVDLADPEQLQPGHHVTSTGMYMHTPPGYLILQDFDGGAFQQAGPSRGTTCGRCSAASQIPT